MRTVATVERYRVEHDSTDKRTLLGPYPEDNPFDQMDWEMIHNSVTDPRHELGIGSPVLARRTINLSGAAAVGGLLRRRRGGRVRYRATRLRCQRNRVSGVTIEPSLSRRGSAAASWGAGD